MKVIPNILTFTRILLAPVFLVLFLSDQELMRALSIVVFTVAAITDYFDGYLARELGARSEFGNFMDPLADKILTFTGFFAICYLRPDLFPWFVFLLILGRDVFVTIMRMVAQRKGVPIQTSYSAKLKTFVQMIFLYLALFAFMLAAFPAYSEFVSIWLFSSGVMSWLFYGVMIFTLYTALEYVLDNKSLFFGEKTVTR